MGGGSPKRASRGPRAPGPRDHGESGRGGEGRERARPARRPLLPGWALNPGRGRRAGGRECVCLSRVIYGGAAGASAEEAAAAAASCNCGSLHLLSLFAP